jgi:hypothetical protein
MDYRALPPTLSTPDLLSLSRCVLRELRVRGVIRSGNAPAGDYAEGLARIATGGTLAGNAQKAWDILTPTGERLQVKARLMTNPNRSAERQLSVFRSWDFDAAMIVLFDDDFAVWKAAKLPTALIEANARRADHVNGWRFTARDDLLALGEDWTEQLRLAATG